MFDNLFGRLQRLGRSFMLPIAILPIAGLFFGVGEALTNPIMISAYNLENILGNGTILNAFFTVIKEAGQIVFNNLSIIFAIGIAIGMAKKEKAVAALSSAIAFLVMHQAISTLLEIDGQIINGQIAQSVPLGAIGSTCGIQSLELGVSGGIIVGFYVAFLHNRFYKVELPATLSFFSGTHFVPIICTIASIVVGTILFFIWPVLQDAIFAFSEVIQKSGYFGTLLFGLIKRALIPLGLHHVFYLPFWQTGLGSSMIIDGQLIQGAQNVFFAQLASPETIHFSVDATRFFSGEFIFMMFGLPGAALAMYHCAKDSNKKLVGGLFFSAALTSVLTGITEPIEFTFLFSAPILYGVHIVLAGTAYMIAHILNVGVGLTFSAGAIDFFLFGILQGNAKTNWLSVLAVGIIYFFLYYFSFKFLIKKFDLKTIGRTEGIDENDKQLFSLHGPEKTKREKLFGLDDLSFEIAEALGGSKNILDVDCCTSRLRATLVDISLINEQAIMKTGASGIIKRGKGAQITYGPKVLIIKSNLEDFLEKYPNV